MRDRWRETTLREVATRTIGRTPPRNDPSMWATSTERPFVTIADLGPNRTVTAREGVSELAEASGHAKRFPAGSLLLSFKLSIGRVGVADRDVFTNEAIARLAPVDGVLRDFLAIALENVNWEELGGRAVKGKTMNKSSLDAVPITLPPLDEQRRIVDLIAAVDDAVDAAEAEADTAKTARDEMLTAMLAARDGWRETTLGELADVLRGAVWRKSDEVGAPDDQHEAVVGIGVTTAGGVINRAAMKYVSGLGDKAKRLAVGDTLMVMSNGNHSRIGNAYAIPDDFVGMPFSAFQAAVRVRERDVVTPTFLSILLGSEELQQAFTDSAAGSTGLGNLKVTYLRAIPIALPPIDEQRRIVATVKSVDDALDAARATAESLRTLRSNLLTVLLSGEHEIPASYDALLGEVA